MEKIKKIEILDMDKDWPEVLIDLPDILEPIGDGSQFNWAIIPIYEPTYIKGDAQDISIKIKDELSKNKIAFIDWTLLNSLAEGVGQFIDLFLIGSKDPKKLRYYEEDDEMFQECDIVIIAFDGCWWEVSCKDGVLMKKYLDTFKEIRVVYWDDEKN